MDIGSIMLLLSRNKSPFNCYMSAVLCAGGKVCARTDPWFRGQTLPVPGHGGGGGGYFLFALGSRPSVCSTRPLHSLSCKCHAAWLWFSEHPLGHQGHRHRRSQIMRSCALLCKRFLSVYFFDAPIAPPA